MSVELPFRGVLTDALADFLQSESSLAAAHILVGDGEVPDSAGWPGEKAGEGIYVASAVLSTGQAAARDRETLASRHSSWVCRYGLRTSGATRTQADNAADLVRAAVLGFQPRSIELGPSEWKVNDLVFSSLAAVETDRTDQAGLWFLTDTLDVWLDRGR